MFAFHREMSWTKRNKMGVSFGGRNGAHTNIVVIVGSGGDDVVVMWWWWFVGHTQWYSGHTWVCNSEVTLGKT